MVMYLFNKYTAVSEARTPPNSKRKCTERNARNYAAVFKKSPIYSALPACKISRLDEERRREVAEAEEEVLDKVERFGCRATESFESLHIRIRSKFCQKSEKNSQN